MVNIRKKSHWEILTTFWITIFFCSYSAVAEVVVVVHPSNDSNLNKQDISKLFLGKKKTFPNGLRAIPINIAQGSETRDEFNEKVVGRNSSQVKAYWSKLLFTGKGVPPKEVSSDKEIIELIAKNPGTIGYVSPGSVTSSVKVVDTF